MQFGRYYEEFEVGATYKHWPGKTVTEYDDHLFCLLTMNHHPLHLDVNYAEKTTDFGKNVVVGNYIYSLLLGMSVPDVSGKAIANLEVESLRHVAPTFHGDTIYGETTVLDKTESKSKDDRGRRLRRDDRLQPGRHGRVHLPAQGDGADQGVHRRARRRAARPPGARRPRAFESAPVAAGRPHSASVVEQRRASGQAGSSSAASPSAPRRRRRRRAASPPTHRADEVVDVVDDAARRRHAPPARRTARRRRVRSPRATSRTHASAADSPGSAPAARHRPAALGRRLSPPDEQDTPVGSNTMPPAQGTRRPDSEASVGSFIRAGWGNSTARRQVITGGSAVGRITTCVLTPNGAGVDVKKLTFFAVIAFLLFFVVTSPGHSPPMSPRPSGTASSPSPTGSPTSSRT